jgi:hypothetical protein
MEASVDPFSGVPFGRLYPRKQGPYSTPINNLWFHEEGRAADIRLALRPADAAAGAGGEPIAVNEAPDDDII